MKIRILIYAALAVVVLSCGGHDRRLCDVDSIMDAEPATALARLDSIRAEELSPDDYAYYALLYTQAQDKCRFIVSSDSLISVAYDKYSRDRSGNLKMRACFYNSRVAFNNNDFKSSMKDAVVAYDIAKEMNLPYWIAKTAEHIADIFWYVYNFPQSEQYTHEAVKYYLLAGRVDNHRYALCDLASIYLNEDRLDDAKTLVDSLYAVVTSETPVDSALLDYLSMPMSSFLLKTNKLDELKQLLEETADVHFPNGDDVDVAIMNSHISNFSNDAENMTASLAEAYGLSEDNKQRIRVMYAEFRQSLYNENYKNAALMADSIILVQGGIVGELLEESVTSAQSDFYSEKAKLQQSTAELRLYILIALATIAVIITILLIIIFRLKIRAKNAEFEANLLSLMRIKSQADEIGLENKRLSSELTEKSKAFESLQKIKSQEEEQNTIVVEHLFREKWSTLNKLCRQYFENINTEDSEFTIIVNIEKELKRLKTRRSLNEIEKAVDLYLGNIMSLLRQECSFLKEEDFIFLSLVFAGLSARSVCLILDIKYKLFYLKKSRLSKRISDSDAPHKELFLTKIN